ncbi:hypothetical protein RYJ27_02060 [Microbacterium limosum]|uniref:Uncharacterized protein n=1 Tax=Microbacterium limosum TaxID=3079935 RepID=A0AAU0MIQ3_9MICO|nr:hypothetical protein [Microbacterium sp. Y20]WOQ70035.1 hypothetical protein RYJ27_02060 [Microbacterium sp. Y20]
MTADHDRDLPEGVIDADPPGGWESGETADQESAEQNAGAIGSPRLTEAGVPVEGPEATQNSDPDLIRDDDLSEDES